MKESSRWSPQEIDEHLTGGATTGDDDMDLVASVMERLFDLTREPVPDNVRQRHLTAMFEALPLVAHESNPVGRSANDAERAAKRAYTRPNKRGRMRKILTPLTAKLAAAALLVLGSGVALAATDNLPQPVADAVDTVAASLGISSADVTVDEFEVGDDGSVEFEGSVPGGEVEFESDECETELETTLNEDSDNETEIESETHASDCDDDDEAADNNLIVVDDNQADDEIDEDEVEEIEDDEADEVEEAETEGVDSDESSVNVVSEDSEEDHEESAEIDD
ncbi:MAG TPA: hypothetical protein VE569_03325 [Acidimicrobiia bacterium]|nr:hypothetical protein [Acidimicrobiia bacterium]